MGLDALDLELDPPLVHDPGLELLDENGAAYRVLVAGRYEGAGMWGGWIEFYPSDPELEPLRTDRETTQTNYTALVQWAHGLGKVYLEGAFERAHVWPPEYGLEVIHTHRHRVVDAAGNVFQVRTCARRRDDGQWIGWLEFEPIDPPGPTLRTTRETTQSSRESMEYWASGLEPVYLEGALQRARY